jgi:hypothetical protein
MTLSFVEDVVYEKMARNGRKTDSQSQISGNTLYYIPYSKRKKMFLVKPKYSFDMESLQL